MITYEENAEYRIKNLPEAIQGHMAKGDPCWSELPSGWHDLVTRLDEELSKVDPDYEIAQCKEKFGGLRYYVDFSEQCQDLKEADDIISKYENMSEITCDVCGEPGKNRAKNGWMATRCETHN